MRKTSHRNDRIPYDMHERRLRIQSPTHAHTNITATKHNAFNCHNIILKTSKIDMRE